MSEVGDTDWRDYFARKVRRGPGGTPKPDQCGNGGMPERTRPEFWRKRINDAIANGMPPRYAVFEMGETHWAEFQRQTTEILRPLVRAGDSILDIGCGIGSLLECLPRSVRYSGIDVSPDFIEIAEKVWKDRLEPRDVRGRVRFAVADMGAPFWMNTKFFRADPDGEGAEHGPARYDWIIGRSVLGTIGRNLPPPHWRRVLKKLPTYCANPPVWIEYEITNDEVRVWTEDAKP